MIENPGQLKWIQGPLPPVESVPYECFALAWLVHRGSHKPEALPELPMSKRCVLAPELEGRFKRITMVFPWKNEGNPLRWVDASGYPIEFEEEVTWWTWIKEI